MIQSQTNSTHKHTSLYLKQFFTNYILRKQHADSINLLSSSLQVLDQLIDQFVLKNNVCIDERSGGKTQKNGNWSKGNYSKQVRIQDIFQRIYQKIKGVFQWVQLQLDRQYKKINNQIYNHQAQNSSRSTSLFSHPHPQTDQQLYQILNQYSQTTKKQKQTIQSLTKKLQQKNSQHLQLKISKQINDKQISYLNSRIEQLERQLDQSKDKLAERQEEIQAKIGSINKLQEKVKQFEGKCKNLFEQNKDIKGYVSQIQDRCNKAVKEKVGLSNKIRQIKQQQQLMIQKKLQQIPKIIQLKLQDKKNWDLSAVQVMKKYMTYRQAGINVNKQNVVNNQNIRMQ